VEATAVVLKQERQWFREGATMLFKFEGEAAQRQGKSDPDHMKEGATLPPGIQKERP
jgi:hypothetical protein